MLSLLAQPIAYAPVAPMRAPAAMMAETGSSLKALSDELNPKVGFWGERHAAPIFS